MYIRRIGKSKSILNKNNAETYKIYLASRPDLGETVREYYLNLIKKIESNEKRLIEEALTRLKDKSENQN